MDQATKNKISISMMGHYIPEETRIKISETMRGSKQSAASNAKRSATLKGRNTQREFRERV